MLQDRELEELNSIDRDALMEQMARDLPVISGGMGTTPSGIAWRTGLDPKRVSLMVSGKRKMKWSEYLSILFVLLDNERGREIVEERGLFPKALKNVLATDRNAHEE